MTDSDRIGIAVSGAGGRMGCRILTLAAEDPRLRPVGALEIESHPAVGRDAGLVAGCGELQVTVTSDAEKALQNADVLIDFSAPSAVSLYEAALLKYKVALVVGTTALEAEERASFDRLSKDVPVIVAPNMSVGVNLLFRIAPLVTKALGEQYDIEIIEAHHNQKKDAPSGTALGLLERILEASPSKESDVVYGREGNTGERPGREIGVHAVRAGDIVGEHTVLYCTGGERIELTHRASSRDTFAKGALRAAAFLKGKAPGSYTMDNVLFGDE